MKHRVLRQNDCAQYSDDLFQCFKDNPQILDEESIDYFESLEKSVNYPHRRKSLAGLRFLL